LGRKEKLPFALTGKPDRISQTMFGKYGEEKRWEALDAISMPGQSYWQKRLLLWTLANENIEMRERSWEILDNLQIEYDLLINELSCPMWQVRLGVIRLLAKSGRLDTIRLLIAGIEDYHPNVVDETKRSLVRLIDNAKIRKLNGELPRDEAQDALNALYQPLYTSKRSARFQAIQFLFKVAPLDEDLFWEMYIHLDLPQYTVLHEEFIRYQKEGSLEVLYRGLMQKDEALKERLTNFLAVAVRNSGDNVNYHLNALRKMERSEFVSVAHVLQHYRILVEFQGLIKHMNPAERIILFDLLEAVGAEQNLSFLLRCLQLDDSRIRIRVLKILGESQTLGLRTEVYEFLTDSDEQVLLATLRYLQKKGDLSIVEKISHLTRSKKKKVKQGVNSTMFKITRDHLLQDFNNLSPLRRMKILTMLKKMKPKFFEEIIYLSESPEESDRIKYLKILEAETLKKAVPEYRRLSQDPNAKVRAQAIMGLGRINDTEILFKMIKPFFKDPDGRVRANSVELMPEARPANEEIIRMVKNAVQSDTLREKANAISKLLKWDYPEYEKPLIEMLNSDDEWIKSSALWVVGENNLPHLVGRLREAANDGRSHVREMAVRGIGKRGTEEDLRALMPYLQDPDRNVRVAAQKALRARLQLSFEIA
jgi:HEAT repeat protein